MMDHPNIIKYVESFEDNRYMYIVQELMTGCRSLQDVFDQALAKRTDPESPVLPLNDVGKLMKMTMIGVTHIHENEIVHRDMKPDNVVIDDKN